MIYTKSILFIFLSLTMQSAAPPLHHSYYNTHHYSGTGNIKSTNGKFYAYIVLLFNENPHFVNMIQKDSIPARVIGSDGFHIKEYKGYQKTIKNNYLKKMSKTILSIYLEPYKFNNAQLHNIEEKLSKLNIIIKFSTERNSSQPKITLDYSIFGKKSPITIKHPLLNINERFYNIQPYIYYEEFSTSNSTFYFDMIYINPIEVNNDYIIAKNIINNKATGSMFFVGSVVTEDIKHCLKKAFPNIKQIRQEIWKMFVVHELTHKILNNKFNNFDQITGEELSLCSTIYVNPYLGLAVMYSYLNYNTINPHRIAAMNIVRYIAKDTNREDIIKNPGHIKNIPVSRIKKIIKTHFYTTLKNPPAELSD